MQKISHNTYRLILLQTKSREDGLPRKALQLRPKGFRSVGNLIEMARPERSHSGPGICSKKDRLHTKNNGGVC